jgi:hypothetical protein
MDVVWDAGTIAEGLTNSERMEVIIVDTNC